MKMAPTIRIIIIKKEKAGRSPQKPGPVSTGSAVLVTVSPVQVESRLGHRPVHMLPLTSSVSPGKRHFFECLRQDFSNVNTDGH